MPRRMSDLLEELRQPAYTGENRCQPCTVLNVCIGICLSAVAALISLPLGATTLLASLLVIYLRGYLVPGTPALTERYLPERIHRMIADHPADQEMTFETIERARRAERNAVEPERFLRDAGAVEFTADGEDLVMTEEFARLVDDLAPASGDEALDPAELATIFGVESDQISVEDRNYPAVKVRVRVRKWPSWGALRADVATHRALRERTDRWLEVPPEQRASILQALRAFHERCPACGGEIGFGDEVMESCCGQFQVRTLGCEDCGERLLEYDPERVKDEAEAKGLAP